MDKNNNQKCPKCSGTGGFFINEYIWGWEERIVNWDGTIEHTNLDKINRRAIPKTGICLDCGKRVNIENIKMY